MLKDLQSSLGDNFVNETGVRKMERMVPCLSPGAIGAPNVNESEGRKSVIHGDTISKSGIEKNWFPGPHLFTF